MSGRRAWTAAEVRRALDRKAAGMSWVEIAASLGRQPGAVKDAVRRAGRGRRDSPGYEPVYTDADRAAARASLAREIAMARVERATAPLLRSWPAGVWEP